MGGGEVSTTLNAPEVPLPDSLSSVPNTHTPSAGEECAYTVHVHTLQVACVHVLFVLCMTCIAHSNACVHVYSVFGELDIACILFTDTLYMTCSCSVFCFLVLKARHFSSYLLPSSIIYVGWKCLS